MTLEMSGLRGVVLIVVEERIIDVVDISLLCDELIVEGHVPSGRHEDDTGGIEIDAIDGDHSIAGKGAVESHTHIGIGIDTARLGSGCCGQHHRGSGQQTCSFALRACSFSCHFR